MPASSGCVSVSRVVLAIVLCLSFALVGCAEAPEAAETPEAPTTPETPNEDEEAGEADAEDDEPEGTYWLVQVRGNETHDPPPSTNCTFAFDHRLVPSEGSLNYSSHFYNLTDPSFVVALDVWDRSDHCPIAYRLHAGTDAVSVDLDHYGNLTLAPQADGSLAVNANGTENELRPGNQFTEIYEDSYEDDRGRQVDVSGEFVVEHLGEWPTDRLTAEDRLSP